MRQVFLDTLDLAGQLVERALVGLVRNQRLALRNSLPNGLRLGIGDGFLSCRSRFGGLIGGFLGGRLYGKVSTKFLKWLFAAFLFYAGVKYLL